mmetsp:Transcript_90785/g.194700  ORF Transcript_90785/g.194700 Transcript_90785/m.194700 type:complete len:226 (-) Transcript_90785:185-862(-)
MPCEAADHHDMGVWVLRDGLEVPKQGRRELRQDLRLVAPVQQSPREAQDHDALGGLAHSSQDPVVVQRGRDLQPFCLALTLCGLQLVKEIRGPMPQRVLVHVAVAVTMQLHAVLGVHLERLLDGIGETIGVPRIHAERCRPQGLGAARELGKDEHPAVPLLLAVEELMSCSRERVPKWRVHEDLGLHEQCSDVHAAELLAQEVHGQMTDQAELAVHLAHHLVDLL